MMIADTRQSRMHNLIGITARLLFACTLIVLGIYLAMSLASSGWAWLTSDTALPTRTIECRRIQVRSDESVHFIDAIGEEAAATQTVKWGEMSTTEREDYATWCRDNNQPTFNELYTTR